MVMCGVDGSTLASTPPTTLSNGRPPQPSRAAPLWPGRALWLPCFLVWATMQEKGCNQGPLRREGLVAVPVGLEATIERSQTKLQRTKWLISARSDAAVCRGDK